MKARIGEGAAAPVSPSRVDDGCTQQRGGGTFVNELRDDGNGVPVVAVFVPLPSLNRCITTRAGGSSIGLVQDPVLNTGRKERRNS